MVLKTLGHRLFRTLTPTLSLVREREQIETQGEQNERKRRDAGEGCGFGRFSRTPKVRYLEGLRIR